MTFCVFVLFLATIVQFSAAAAQTCVNYDTGVNFAGSVIVPGASLQAVSTDGVNLVTASGDGQIAWTSIGTDGMPVVEGSYVVSGVPTDVALTGALACVALGSGGVELIDFTDPLVPVSLVTIPAVGVSLDLAVGGDLLMIAEGAAGLRMFDISTPTAPVPYGTLAVDPADKVAWEGGVCWISGGSLNLWTYDVSDPAAPDLLDYYSEAFMSHRTTDLHVADGKMYWTYWVTYYDEGENLVKYVGVGVYDVADSANRHLLASVTVSPYQGGEPILATGHGDYYYFFSGGNLSFRLIGANLPFSVFHGASVIDMAAAGRYLYAVHDGSIDIYAVFGGENPLHTQIGMYNSGGDTYYDILRVGDALYCSGYHQGDEWNPESYSWIDRVDVSDPAAPVRLSWIAATLWGTRTNVMAHHGDLLYTHSGIYDLNTTNRVGTFTAGDCNFVSGDALCVYDDPGVEIYDLTTPTAPVHRGALLAGRRVISMTEGDGYGYTWMEDGSLAVLDLTDPSAPVLIDDITLPSRCDYGSRRGVLLLGTGFETLQAFDLTDPAHPAAIGSLALSGLPVAIGEPSNLVYVTLSDGAFVAVDVSDPTAPIEWARFTPDQPSFCNVDVDNGFYVRVGTTLRNYVYDCADSRTGLSAVDDEAGGTLPGSLGPFLSAAYPNPFNPVLCLEVTADMAGPAAVDIHDLRGRLVRRLAAGRLVSGVNRFAWDGRDQQGRSLPAGTYLVVIDAAAGMNSRKVTLLK